MSSLRDIIKKLSSPSVMNVLCAIAALCLVCSFIGLTSLGNRLEKMTNERNAYFRNTEVLLSQIDTFRLKNGQLAAKVADLELKESDFNRLMTDDAKLIKQLKSRNEELDRLVKIYKESEVNVVTLVRDSIVYVDKAEETLQVIEWSDKPWASFKASISNGSIAEVSMSHVDSLDVAVFLDWKKFLWWKTRLKGCNVKVVSKNPYTNDVDVSSISINHKK